MGISIGMVGLGVFGGAFVDLFKSHPLVDRIAFCDREPERVKKYAESKFLQSKFNINDAYSSLDDICKSDLDALIIMTQPWLHAPQCIQAMEAGMDVYSAVPLISLPDDEEILDWCDQVVTTSQKTGKHYMLGETTFYRANAMFCRKMENQGKFGDFVYAEGEYFHDVDSSCSLRKVKKARLKSKAGAEWVKEMEKYENCKRGPMHYPTHSVSGPACVMNTRASKVTAYGYTNKLNDPFFENAFSNEVALFKMNNGSTVRIIEARECAGRLGLEDETFRIIGTSGTYSEKKWYYNGRTNPKNGKAAEISMLTDDEMRDPLPSEVQNAFKQAMNKDMNSGDLQNIDFTPQGHGGSHPYLVHEFIDAVANNRTPEINAWNAAHYMAMGVMAHKSALKDGETFNVPDWGDAPK